MRSIMIAILPMILLAGCAEEARQVPASTAFRGAGSNSTEPEPPNSLPRGSTVNAPLTNRVGDIENTRVGPAAPGTARAGSFTSSRY